MTTEPKKKLDSKTIKVSVLTAILGALTIFASYLEISQPFIKEVFTPDFATKALGLLGILSGVIHFVLRLLTTGPILKADAKSDSGFTRSPLMILILVLGLMIGAVSCTAAQRAIWGKVTAGVAGAVADGVCASMGLKCKDFGGDFCRAMVSEGCHMGRPYLVDLIGKAVAGEQPDPVRIRAETVIAFKTDQALIHYASRMAPTMALDKVTKTKAKAECIGFKCAGSRTPTTAGSSQPAATAGIETRTPTTADGGAGARDTPPMVIK